MKKVFSKFSLVGIILLFSLASCLDDGGGSSREITRSFAVVTTTDLGTKVLYVYYLSEYGYAFAGPLSTDEFQESSLKAGDCAFVDVKFDPNTPNGSYAKTEYIRIDEEQIYKKEDQLVASTGLFNATELGDDKTYFTTLPTQLSSNRLIVVTGIGEKWYVAYTYPGRNGEQAPKLLVTFDEENHVENNKGEIFLDFQLQKQGTELQGDLKSKTGTAVVEFSALKSLLEEYKNSDNQVKIKFRYFLQKTNTKEGELPYEPKESSSTVYTYVFND